MTLAEVQSAFAGVVMLFRGRAEGLALMDRSVGGFWRSFLTILLVIPSVAIARVAQLRLMGEPLAALSLLELVPLLALDFALLPLVLALIARPLGLSRSYVDFVVARNWGAPVAAALLCLPFVFAGAGWIGPDATGVLSLVLNFVVLRYQWMALRLALRADVPVAIALLVAEVVISLFLGALFTEA